MKLDGKEITTIIQAELIDLIQQNSLEPVLVVIMVGDNPASLQYIRAKKTFGEDLGVQVEVVQLDESVTTQEVVEIIQKLQDLNTGIMIQLPLPNALDKDLILSSIKPFKDVDVLNSKTQELIFSKALGFEKIGAPVALAVEKLLREADIDITNTNKKFLVVGQGEVVGKPISRLLQSFNVDYNSITIETPEEEKSQLFKEADVIISGVGVSGLVQPEMIQKGVVLIDAGTSVVGASALGDIDPDCYPKASFYSPVPGGVGPVAVAMLFSNLMQLELVHKKS